MHKTNLKSKIYKEGNYYISQYLDVDISSFGKTKKEALNNLKDALKLYYDKQ